LEGIRVSLDSTGPSNGISLVRVDGIIDTMTASELERVLDSLLQQQKFNIIIDLAGVDYISSAGWGIFISNIREIRAHSGDIKLARMVSGVHEIFELLEFDSILQAFDNIETARNAFQLPDDVTAPREPETTTETIPATGGSNANVEEVTGITPDHVAVDSTATGDTTSGGPSLEEEVLGLVRTDPFYSIREITNLVNEGRNGSSQKLVSWWKIWNILRRHSLLSKKKRFRFSRSKL
jgi:anti-sigma B factor antagonist